MFSTVSMAPDGRPLIEVDVGEWSAKKLVLEGTAVAYEATILAKLEYEDSTSEVLVVTASAGGPERGSWCLEKGLSQPVTLIVLHQEEMEEGRAAQPHATVRLTRLGSRIAQVES